MSPETNQNEIIYENMLNINKSGFILHISSIERLLQMRNRSSIHTHTNRCQSQFSIEHSLDSPSKIGFIRSDVYFSHLHCNIVQWKCPEGIFCVSPFIL